MTGLPFDLTREASDPALVAELVAGGARRIGLAGVLARRGSRALPAFGRRGAVRTEFRWNLRDTVDGTWWPQGIDISERDGRRILVVSWFAQPVRGVQRGVRLTFVDLRSRRLPRYHHVLLVEPTRDTANRVALEPVAIHAGGVAWLDDRILVADTFSGLREFHLDDLLRVPRGPFGYDQVLPQSARHLLTAPKEDRGMRFSFVSIEHTDGIPMIVAGEHGDGDRADRLIRFGLDGRRAGELHEPGIHRMQGACVVDGRWYVTTGNGPRTGGDLWAGTPGEMARYRHVLPAGPEDLAVDRRTGRLWSLSEWPGRRVVFTIDPARLAGGVPQGTVGP